MRTLTNILVFILILAGTGKLNTYTQQPHLHPAEARVLEMVTYGLGGGLAVNTVCAFAAPYLDPDIPGRDGFVSCAPYGILASCITSRLYVYLTGGWALEEWWFARRLPRRLPAHVAVMMGYGVSGLEVAGLQTTKQPREPESEL
jgi:hypothetical protein